MFKNKLGKRILSSVLSASIAFTTFFSGGVPVFADEGLPNESSKYPIMLNDSSCMNGTPIEIVYGTPMVINLDGLTDAATINYYYSKYSTFMDESSNTSSEKVIQNSSEFTQSLEVGVPYYIGYVADINGENVEDFDGNHIFTVVPAKLSGAQSVNWGDNYNASWSQVTNATNEVGLISGAVGGYEVHLYKDDTEIDLDDLSDATGKVIPPDVTGIDLSSYVLAAGYGSYTYTVKTLVSLDASAKYFDSETVTSNIATYKDELPPVFSGDILPEFDADNQILSVGATDAESGIVAFAITTTDTLDSSLIDWISIDNPGAGSVVGRDVLNKVLDNDSAAGTYCFYIKDAFGNVTQSDTKITVRKVTYHNDGVGTDAIDTSVFYTEDTHTLKTPERSGYTFIGWYLDAAFNTGAPSVITTDNLLNNATDVYAKWNFNDVVFTKHPNDGVKYENTYTGINVPLTAAISNTDGTITWKWQKKNESDTWEDISGASTNTYNVRNVADSGTYRAVAKVQIGSDVKQSESIPVDVIISPAEINIKADDITVYYGDVKPALTYSLVSLVGDDTKDNIIITEGTLECTVWDNAGVLPTYGTYPIVVSGFEIENYTVNHVNGTLTIDSHNVETDAKITATLEQEKYKYAIDENQQAVSYEPAVTVYNDGNVVPSSEYSLNYYSNNVAGTARVEIVFNGTNYKGSITKYFEIEQDSFTTQVNMSGWKYGEIPNSPSVMSNVSGGTITYYYEDSKNASLGTTRPVHAGTYYVYAVIAETNDYAQSTTEKVEFTILPREITVTAGSGKWSYDGNPHRVEKTEITGDGFIEGDDFQSIIITGEITDKGTVENKVKCTLPDHILKSDYIINEVSGTLTVTEAKLQVPGGAVWSNEFGHIGRAEWVAVVKPNLDIDYELQLFRRNVDGTYVDISDKIKTNKQEYDFKTLIYEDANKCYFEENAQGVISYVYSVQAYPSGGSAKENYALSDVSDYTKMSHLGSCLVTLNKDENNTSVSAERYYNPGATDITDTTFVAIAGEEFRVSTTCEAPYKVVGSVWTINSDISGCWIDRTGYEYNDMKENHSYVNLPNTIPTGDKYQVYVTAHAYDREPVIEEYKAERTADGKVYFTIKASDGIALSGWKFEKAITAGDTHPVPDNNWLTEGISEDKRTINLTKEITEPGSYYLFIKDSSGSIVGGWKYSDEEDYKVLKVYQISFNSGDELSVGEMEPVLKLEDEEIIIPDMKYSVAGKTFKNWKTKNNNILENNATYVLNQNDTLTAIWTSEQYTYKVRYHYQDIMEDLTADKDEDKLKLFYKSDAELEAAGETLETQSFKAGYNEVIDPTKEAYKKILNDKKGFVLDADKSGTITVVDNTAIFDLYYARDKYTLSYSYRNTNGSTVDAGEQIYYFGQKVVEIEKPAEQAGYKFVGWNYESLGGKPDTMPAQDVEATGSYSAQTVKYKIVYYYETLTAGEYAYSGYEEKNATQGESITMDLGSITNTFGFTNYKVIALTESDNPYSATVPETASTSATGIASAAEGDELYFVYYKSRNTYNLTLNVWQGDRLNGGKNVYTYNWSLKYDEPISDANFYSEYGMEDKWKAAATANGIDLSEYVVADYVDWSTEKAPSRMPFGDVVVSREYVLSQMEPYNIDVYLENSNGEYEFKESIIYNGALGSTVTIGDGKTGTYTIDYNTFAESIASFSYYQYISKAEEVLSGKVITGDFDSRLHLKIYFERKSYKVTLTFYDGITDKIKEVVVNRKWGTKFEFTPEAYFDYIVNGDKTYTENSDKSNINTFRNKKYLVSYNTYYWDTSIDSYGNSSGHYYSKNIDTVEDLPKTYSVTVGMNDGTYARIYYAEPEVDKQYYYDIYYNPSNLTYGEQYRIPLTLADAANPDITYKIRVANKIYVYNSEIATSSEYATYPGLGIKKGEWTYGTLKSDYTFKKVTCDGKTYTFPVDKEGYVYLVNTVNQFYEGNRISFSYKSGTLQAGTPSEIDNGGANIAYSIVENYLKQYKVEHADDSTSPDPKGASTAYIYYSGTSHLCEDYTEGHISEFTFGYNNWCNLTFKLGDNSCKAHTYLYNTRIENVGSVCTHTGAFPQREGYDIVWYMDTSFTRPVEDFNIKGDTTVYGRYEKSVIMNNEYLVFPLAEPITVNSITYSDNLTETQVLAIKAANDPNYVVTVDESNSVIKITDNETGKEKPIDCPNIKYFLNGIPVLINRHRPALPAYTIEMKVDDIENPSDTTMQAYAPEGFRFDDTNINNKLKGYVQYAPISLYAYFVRNNIRLTKERLLSETDNPIVEIHPYGTTVTLSKLGTSKETEKEGYLFDGWELYLTGSEDEQGNLTKITDVTINEVGDSYKFLMPSYDTTVRAIWKPSSKTYKLYHYFQDEAKSYNIDLVTELIREVGSSCTCNFAGDTITGLVYLDGETVKGASINYNGLVLYFANAIKNEDASYSLSESDLIGAISNATYTSEESYPVNGTIISDSNITIFRYASTVYDHQNDHEVYTINDNFVAYPTMTFANYYERSTDYDVDATAIATDGKVAEVTITGTGDCYYGQKVNVNASLAEGYNFIGWYNYSDIYNSDGSFTEGYINTFGDGDGDGDKLTALSTSETISFTVVKKYRLVAVVKAREVQLPSVSISGKTEYVYGYAASASNVLSVGVDLSGVDSATYIKGYQWMLKKPGEDEFTTIAGATSANYIIPAGLTAGEYEYECKVVVARKDNGREIETLKSQVVTVAAAKLKIEGTSYVTEYNAYNHRVGLTFPTGFSSYYVDNNYNLEFYYSKEALTVENYESMYSLGKCKKTDRYNGTSGYIEDEEYQYKDVKVNESGEVIYHVNYIVIHDPRGNYEDIALESRVKINPITVTLKATSSVFNKVYDGTTAVTGLVTEEGSQKNTIAKGTFYTVNGILDGELDSTLLDFDAEFNFAHVKDASAVHLSNIKVVFADGRTNYNYAFADSYFLNISGHIEPFELSAKWSDEREFVYNGKLQAPTASLLEGVDAPDGSDFELTVVGKQTNVGSYTANLIVEDKDGAYYSSDYKFSTEGCPYTITKKKILVTPVSGKFTYDGTKHYLNEDVTVAGYEDNDITKPITVVEGNKSGLVAENHKITFGTNKGYIDAGKYTDITANNIKIEEVSIVNDKTVNKAVTGNYDIYYGNGIMNIEKKLVKLTGITANDKYYDGNDTAQLIYVTDDVDNIVYDGKLTNDKLSYDTSYIKGKFENEHIGNDKNVTISFTEAALCGDDVRNYKLDTTNQTVKASILAKGLTVKADEVTQVYGEPITFKYSCNGFGEYDQSKTLSGSATYKIYRWKDEAKTEKEYFSTEKPAVGTYYIEIDMANSTLSNPDYDISWDSVNWQEQKLTITRRPIAIKASDSANVENADATNVVAKSYDGNTKATDIVRGIADFTPYYEFTGVESNSKSGVVGDDSIKLLVKEADNSAFSAVYNSSTVALATKVTLSNLKIDNSNYELVNTSFDVKGKINKLPLTITAKSFTGDDAIVYGTKTIDYDVTVTGFLETEEETEKAKITYTSTYDANDAAKRNVTSGEDYYKVSPVYENSNYEVTINVGNIQVLPKEVTITPVPSKSVVYGIDVTMPTVAPSYEGWVFEEDDSVITSGKDALSNYDSIECEVTSSNVNEKLPDDYDMTYKADTLTGLVSNNYSFVTGIGTLHIARQEISISGITVNGKVYNGKTDVASTDINLESVVINYYVDGVKKTESATSELLSSNFNISAAYRDKNAGSGKDVDLTVELKGDFATKYTFKTKGDDASQTTTTADITSAPLTITAKPRTIYFGEILTFVSDKPGDYVTSGESGSNDFVNGEGFDDLKVYGSLTYGAYKKGTTPKVAYAVGSPAGNDYVIEIGGYDKNPSWGTPNYTITFVNNDACVLSIDPATLETPAPVWSSTNAGSITWNAIKNVGADPNLVKVDHYEVWLYKANVKNDAKDECKDATLIANSHRTISYVEGNTVYSTDYEELIRQNGDGIYHVQVQAFASTVNNESYCNVKEQSAKGTTAKGLFAVYVNVKFAADGYSQAASGSDSPNFVIGPDADASRYLMIEGEDNVNIEATLKNATGYSVTKCEGDFLSDSEVASEDNPVGVIVSDGALSGIKYKAKVAFGKNVELTSKAERNVILTLTPTKPTLSLELTLTNDHAKYGYSETAAPKFTVTASVVADNVTTSGYTYKYQWYVKESRMGTYEKYGELIESDSNTNTYSLPQGKKPGSNYYYAYCEVTAVRKDNGLEASDSTNKNTAASIDKGVITDAKVINSEAGVDSLDWVYGEKRVVFDVSPNISGGDVSYLYRTKDGAEYTSTKPCNVGEYYVKATIAQTTNYDSFTTDEELFRITKAKLAKPSSITMNPSSTAPYGLIKWDAVEGPKENAGATDDSDMTIAVKYKVSFIYENDEAGNAVNTELKTVTITDTKYDFTDCVDKSGTYMVKVQALVGNEATQLSKAKGNCDDSEVAVSEAKLNIGTVIKCASEGYTKVYDGTPMKLYIEYALGDSTKYQWMKNNVDIPDANDKEINISYVDENATYICKISPNGTWTDDDSIMSTPAVAKIVPREVTISTKNATKYFDGEALKYSSDIAKYEDGKTYSVQAMSGNVGIVVNSESTYDEVSSIAQSGEVTLATEGSNTVESTFDSVIITRHIGDTTKVVYDEAFKDDPSNTNNYVVKKSYGTLTVNKRRITVTAKNANHVYNGNSLSQGEYEITLTNPDDFAEGTDALCTGHVATVTTEGSKLNAYTSDDVANIVKSVVIKKGETDYTDCYDITKTSGTLTIDPRSLGENSSYSDGVKVSFVSDDPYEEIYNGTAHTPVITITDDLTKIGGSNSSYVLSATGDNPDYKIVGYTNNVNAGTATITIQGLNNYSGTIIKTFTIKPLAVSLTWSGNSFVYDGSDKTVTAVIDNVKTKTDAVTSDDVSVATYSDNVKNSVGSYTATALTLAGTDKDNYTLVGATNVTHDWSIGNTLGKIEITSEASAHNKTYDATTINPVKYSKLGTGVVTIEYYKVTEEGADKTYTKIAETTGTGEVKDNVNAEKYNGVGNTSNELPLDAGEYTVIAKVAADNNYSAAVSANDPKDGYRIIITKRAVTFTADSGEKDYDAVALTKDTYTVNAPTADSGLVNGHVANVTITGSQLTIGISDNVITNVVIKESGAATAKDVTANYNISKVSGTLKVNKADEEVILTIADKVYDATSTLSPTVTKKGDGTVEYKYYDKSQNELSGAPVNAGEYYIKAFVKDSTYHKDASSDMVAFKILARDITITANDANKDYDGETLTNATYTLTEATENSGLIAGHVLNVTVTGSQLNAGESANKVTAVVIKDSAETTAEDVTSNYNVIKVNGKLTVNKIADVVTLTVNDKVYDATSDIVTVVTKNGDGNVTYKYFDKNQVALNNAPVDVGEYYVEAMVTDSTNYNDANSEKVSFKITKRKLIIATEGNEKIYDGNALTKDVYTTKGTDEAESGLVSGKDKLTLTVNGSQTVVGSSYNTITNVRIVSIEGNRDVTGNYEITEELGVLKVTSADDAVVLTVKDKVYDATPITPNVTQKGDGALTVRYYDKDKNLIDYIPVNVGIYYAKAFVTGSTNHNDGESGLEVYSIKKREILITADSGEKIYDGTALENNNYKLDKTKADPSGLIDGQKVVAEILGSITVVGEIANTVNEVKIYESESENALDVTENYEVIKVNGKLVVKKASEQITLSIKDKVYDGVAVKAPIVERIGDGNVKVIYYNSNREELADVPINAGEYFVKAFITNSSLYTDASTDYVSFKILKRPIKITANSSEKVYDGTELTCTDWVVEESYDQDTTTPQKEKMDSINSLNAFSKLGKIFADGNSSDEDKERGIVKGHNVNVKISGSQTDAGSSTNKIVSVTITDSNGLDVTENYAFENVDGVLTVKKASEEIILEAKDVVYDASTFDEYTVTKKGDGNLKITFYDSNKKPIENAPSSAGIYYVKAAISNSKNYIDAETDFVSFEIIKREISISAESKSKVYDKEPLTCNEYKVLETKTNPSGLMEGHNTQVTISGSQTNVGKSDNKITAVMISDKDGNDVTDNYAIQKTNGTLTVEKAKEEAKVIAIDIDFTGNHYSDYTVNYTGDGTVVVKFYDQNMNELTEPPIEPGNYYVKIFVTGSHNYEDTESDFVSFEIKKEDEEEYSEEDTDSTPDPEGTNVNSDGINTADNANPLWYLLLVLVSGTYILTASFTTKRKEE